MNRYGQMALRHWSRWLPQRMAGIPDAASFFSTLGRDVAQQIDLLSDRLAGPDRPGETPLHKIGRLREARMTAESEILRQEVLLAPEDEESPAPSTAVGDWISMTEDPDDPIRQQGITYLAENEPT